MNQALSAVAEPLDAQARQQLQVAVAGFDREQLLWSSGFLAGLATQGRSDTVAPPATQSAQRWSIYFATETGNSRRVAETLAARTREAGLPVDLQDLRDTRPKVLTRDHHALFVVATHGVGEVPEGSEPFFEFWFGDKAPALTQLHYSVLALGDSSYADFCEIGQRLDARLSELGATRIAARVDCDLDFDAPATRWSETVLDAAAAMTGAPAARPAHLHAVQTTRPASRERPFDAPVLAVQPITGQSSSKAVYHLELDTDDAALHYEPGDSLGVVALNPPELVENILQATKLSHDAIVRTGDKDINLAESLLRQCEITALSRPLLERLALSHPEIAGVLADRGAFVNLLKTCQVIDLLHDYAHNWQAQELVDHLRRLTPRLYSIASSPLANPGEVHLTVAEVRYRLYGREHWGAASTFLASAPESVPVYVERNDHFRLPENGDTPVIMIGAGTGVAPFRAFIEQRRALGHRGDNWLFYGDRNFSSDFLYQLEWLRYRKDGLLTRLDVAFSRDQPQKHYVQHRVLEHAAEFRRWLERGAHIYVCGDADNMAVGVHKALQSLLTTSPGQPADAAEACLSDLKASGRYQRDVY